VPRTNQVKAKDNDNLDSDSDEKKSSWDLAYEGYSTRNVIMEERNVFCGPYNVLMLKEKRDVYRRAHMQNCKVVYGSFDKKVRFIDAKSAMEDGKVLRGHAGSIKSILVCENLPIVITSSYDTTIR
jgi:F-box and WD-40 domain protein 10